MALAEMNGERIAVQIFQESLKQNRLAHAYLLAGGIPENAERLALQIAKTLHCTSPPRRAPSGQSLDSCDACRNCLQIQKREHPDVEWVRPESKSRIITIAQIRSVLEGIHLKSREGGYKVRIIANADRMNAQAANAFLKTLEEPPDLSLILLLASDPDRLLGTMVSRCRKISLTNPRQLSAEEDALDWLKLLCEKTATQCGIGARYHILGALLELLAERKSRIEKDLSDASPLHTHEDLQPDLRERYKRMLTANIEAEYRRERADVIALFQWFLRDIWLQTLRGESLLRLPSLKKYTAKIAERITPKEALQNAELADQLQRQLNMNVQESLSIEVALLKIAL